MSGKTRLIYAVMALLFVGCMFSVICEDAKAESDVKINGSLRYRHEYMDLENDDGARNRNRVQAKIGLKAQANDQVDLGFALVSGGAGATSTNQTLDGAFSTKGLMLDLAYFNYHPNAVEGLNVLGGKYKNPFYVPQKTELVWDGDLRFEGLGVTYKMDKDRFEPFGVAGLYWIDEVHAAANNDAEDQLLLGIQGGVKFNFEIASSDAYVKGGLGYFGFMNSDVKDGGLGQVDPDDGYTVIDFIAEFGMKVSDIPFSVFFDLAMNTAADDEDLGWLFGVQLGKAKEKGSWDVRLNYRDEGEQVMPMGLVDSDIFDGARAGSGIEIGANYALAEHTTTGLTIFSATIGQDEAMAKEDITRIQLDIKFKF